MIRRLRETGGTSEDLSVAETAAVLGCSEATVKT
jgi:hypothetical protein